MNNQTLRVLYLDLNSFFAQVEQLDNPALRGRPVAVLPLMSEHTCCIAASYQAKKYGIKCNTSVADAKRLCPDIVFLPARHDRYVEIHHQVIAAVSKVVVIEQVCSIDEMACTIPAIWSSINASQALATRVKAALHDAFGGLLTASVGIASNAFLAKLASDMQKPDGLVVLDPKLMPEPILDLPIQDLCGIGRNMQRRLNRAGIWRVADLWPLSSANLRALWHSVEGAYVWQNLHGFISVRPPTQKSIIGHSRVLDPILRDPHGAEQMITQLLLKSCVRLRRYNLSAARISIGVKTVDGKRWYGDLKTATSDDSSLFLYGLRQLWGTMLHQLKPARLLKISVNLSDLIATEQVTGDLFAYTAAQNMPTQSYQKPRPDLSHALDNLNAKYGQGTVQFGLNTVATNGYVGTKIAFNRIPEQIEFSE